MEVVDVCVVCFHKEENFWVIFTGRATGGESEKGGGREVALLLSGSETVSGVRYR